MTTRTNRLQAVLLAVLLAIGAGLTWGVVVGWARVIINNVVLRSRQVSESIVLLGDGTPLIRSCCAVDYQTTCTYRTLDGRQMGDVTIPPQKQFNLLTTLGQSQSEFTTLPWNRRITPTFLRPISEEVWYIVHDGSMYGRAYVVGFHVPTRLTIGYVGQHGFRPDFPPPDDQFPIHGNRFRESKSLFHDARGTGDRYVLTDEGLVRIDWVKRSVKLVWKDSNPGSVRLWYDFNDAGKLANQAIIACSSDRVCVLDADGHVQETFALPAELRDVSLGWTPLGDGRSLAWSQWGPKCKMYWLDANGIVRRETVDLQHSVDSAIVKASFVSVMVPVPVVCAALPVLMPFEPPFVYEEGSYWARVAEALPDTWPPVLIVLALGVALAWLCYRRQRQYGMPWTPAWVVFVFLFGLPGYIGYRTHRRWPTCLPCPSCGRNVPRDRPACCHCHHDFLAPTANGTEVFAESISVL